MKHFMIGIVGGLVCIGTETVSLGLAAAVALAVMTEFVGKEAP